MEGDNSVVEGDSAVVKEIESSGAVNGLNGYSDKHKSEHKHKDKDKYRDKDRDKSKSKDHKSSGKDKDRNKDRDKERDKHSTSKDKERHSSSHKSSSKDKDKDKDKEKHREKDKEKHRDDKDKKTSSSLKEKDRDHKSSSSKDKDRDQKTSSSKDKDRKDRDKEKSREKERSKDKDRKSSSSKDKHRDKDKDRHHSSSKDKERRDRDKDKESKEKKYDEDDLRNKVKEEIKEEPAPKQEDTFSTDDDEDKLVIKDEPSSQDEGESYNNLSQASSCDYNLSQFSKGESTFENSEDDQGYSEAQDESQDEDFKPAKEEEDSEEDMPLQVRNKAARINQNKRKLDEDEDDEEDDVPLMSRKKIKKEKEQKKKKKKHIDSDEDEYEDCKPQKKKKVKKEKIKQETIKEESPKKGGRKKKEEEVQEVWKWWEEEKKEDGVKWNYLEHKGPVFAPPYEPLPKSVKFFYDGKEIELSPKAEEIAGFYAKMLDHDYTTKEAFNKNFFHDWRESMTSSERAKITDLKKCNFKPMHAYFMDIAEKNRNKTKEEKQAVKEKNEAMMKEYGFCVIDGHKEKIGNFKIEPPGLFRGRGEHPKMGKLKRRVEPEDIIINCSKKSKIPEPPPGHKWKEVRHDDKVTWLASWTENVQNQVKYIMLNPSSKLKGEKDWQKYETARRLHQKVDKLRENYQLDWKSKEMKIRQRAVALYFIDKLALRAGNEKDEDQADTVGCCSLRVEHIELHEERDDKRYVVVFDFLGKDSIRYYNEVPVEKRVFKNLQLFMENKKEGDDLFDRLNTSIMNKHLNELMEGLTAKVFRTYNASWTLQQQLDELTNENDSIAEKILSYNRANRAVAILCNHQRAVPKGHQKSMDALKEKIETKRDQVKDAERQVKDAQRDAKHGSVKEKVVYDKKKKMLERMREQLAKLEIQETDRDENKTIALGTSKLNYLDPRISVAWCKKYGVPIEKIYNKTQRDKFRWAIDMAGPSYRFEKIK
ncbi:DNA topoisomerase I, mitochondrial [Euwallacea similis]|uniref:DNA topoisomerase I, mitochondrial n=1 Tax=Euwallacea similis TaxID=1736056 RepID=UPI00344FA322